MSLDGINEIANIYGCIVSEKNGSFEIRWAGNNNLQGSYADHDAAMDAIMKLSPIKEIIDSVIKAISSEEYTMGYEAAKREGLED